MKDIEKIREQLWEYFEDGKLWLYFLPNDAVIDNNDLSRLMRVTERTLHNWRKEGRINYSQIEKKIYYTMGDVRTLICQHYKVNTTAEGNSDQ